MSKMNVDVDNITIQFPKIKPTFTSSKTTGGHVYICKTECLTSI